ncbi:hypothetical protein JCM8547_007776 [Rhodosporidiobolus lusitaniae]
MGHLNFQEIIEHSKQGTDVLYPPMDMPDTEYPSEREARIAKRYNNIMNEMRYTPYWIEAPQRASTDIERWSDRFKPKATSAATVHAALKGVHEYRQWDRDLLPPSVFEAVLEKKTKTKASTKARKANARLGGLLEGDDEQAVEEGSDQDEEDEEALEEDEEDDDGDNDYEAEYFDNGEDDDMDALGGGGGGDDDGGIMD